jgi:hypothetical protein
MKISAIEGERQMAKLKFDGLSSLPGIAHFLNNAFRVWLDKTMDELEKLKKMVGGYNALLSTMKDRVDHLNRRAGDRDAKMGRVLRDIAAVDKVQTGALNRLTQRLEKLEKHCAECKCHDKPKKAPKPKPDKKK